jgi:Carboxyl transferase domain
MVDELLGIIPTDIRQPLNMREVLLRIIDSSRMDEFKPLYGTGLITAWAHIHGTLRPLRDVFLSLLALDLLITDVSNVYLGRPSNRHNSKPDPRDIHQRIPKSSPIHPIMQPILSTHPLHAQRHRIHGRSKDREGGISEKWLSFRGRSQSISGPAYKRYLWR